jgi:hypothetical protein
MTAPDPRALALSVFLREQAAGFALSADVNDSPHIAEAGMALLAAADLAARLYSREPLLVEMSERGMFESMPDHGSRVVPRDEINRFIRRGLVEGPRDPEAILQGMLDALPPGPLG